jgi:hypothetical protein
MRDRHSHWILPLIRPNANLLALTATLLLSCQGELGEPSGGSGGPPVEPPITPTCDPTADPIRRLTSVEYANSVAALLPGVTLPTQQPVEDERIHGFLGQADGQAVSALGVQRYEELAEAAGLAASVALESWASCTEPTVACAQEIATTFGAAAYRRPLSAEEAEALEEYAADTFDEFGFESSVALTVHALLESPFFLYRPELGTGDGLATTPLTDYEMASRLSYFFLDTSPDDALLAAAAEGRLSSDDDLRQEVERLLTDPRARPILTGFFAEWLRLYKIDELGLDPGAFPEFTEELRVDLAESARLYLERALWEDDAWESLMQGHYGFVNDRLAPIFGVPAPGTDELILVELPPGERSGILTQPGLLASTSHGIAHSSIYRGVTVLEKVLCNDIPAPPPGILDNLEEIPVEPGEVCTERDRVAKTHSAGEGCMSCHQSIDSVGFSYEHYDALGRYRTEENGCMVDASTVIDVGDIGEVSNAVDLAEALATNQRPKTCMTKHLFRFASGRREALGDTCTIDAVTEALDASGGSLQDAMVELVLSPAFRRRPTLPGEGN